MGNKPVLKDKSGLTLLELAFALAILAPILLAVIGVNLYALRAGESSRQITTAMQDAHTIIEQIRDTSEQGLNQVLTEFPDTQAVSGFSNLTNEQATVNYNDVNADPLVTTVTVQWTDRGRSINRALTTQITQR